MKLLRKFLAVGLATAGLAITGEAQAGGAGPRAVVGGHPYHNGNLFIPPSSAYEGPRVFPPARYGFPAYYVPGSYLPPGIAYRPFVWYPGVPAARAGGYYMSSYGMYNTNRW